MSTARGFLRRAARRADEAAFARRVQRADAAVEPVRSDDLRARIVDVGSLPRGAWTAGDVHVSMVGQLHAPRSDWARRAAADGGLVAVRTFTDPTRGTLVVQVTTVGDATDAAAAVADVPDTAVARADRTVAMSRVVDAPVVDGAEGVLAHELLLVGRVLWTTVAAHRGARWVAVRGVGIRGAFIVDDLASVAAAQLHRLA